MPPAGLTPPYTSASIGGTRREGPLPNPDVQYPELEQPAAFACTNRICSQPVFDPAELGGTVTQMLAATGAKGYTLFP
jgi:hypothetical protein